MARVVGMKAGMPKEVPAFTVNRLCGTGVQAIVSAAQAIQTGDADVALAGGAESMSRGPTGCPPPAGARAWATASSWTPSSAALTDPFHDIHMGVTAENLAESARTSRARSRTTSRSSRTAARGAAQEAGRFDEQIVPVQLKAEGGDAVRARRAPAPGRLARAAGEAATGLQARRRTVTAGNASGMNDAGAASS